MSLRRHYRGKIFFFQKCVLFTEILSEKVLQYRGFYTHLEVRIASKEGKNNFFLYKNKRGLEEIKCSADLIVIQFCIDLLSDMIRIKGMFFNYNYII